MSCKCSLVIIMQEVIEWGISFNQVINKSNAAQANCKPAAMRKGGLLLQIGPGYLVRPASISIPP